MGLAMMHACVCAAMATVLVDTVHRQPEYVHACMHTYIHTCSSKSARYALYLGSYVRTQCTYTYVCSLYAGRRACAHYYWYMPIHRHVLYVCM